jgi:hypothetical protein
MTASILFRSRRRLAPFVLAGAASLLAACGGGGGADGTAAADPTAAASEAAAVSLKTGRITGFGSIIVDGVRYDDSTASFADDDGGSRDRSGMRLGMVVEVQGGRIDPATARARAVAFVVRSEIEGPVEAVDAAAGTLTVLGQALRVDASTVYEDVAGLAGLSVGQLVEVHSLPGTDGRRIATRIDRESSMQRYELRGRVASVDTVARTFRIGEATISYATLAVPRAPVDGQLVKVDLATVPVNGTWVAIRMRDGGFASRIADRNELEVEGRVSGFESLARFSVGGVPVDASGPGVRFEDGARVALADGVRVEVEGRMVDGVLIARKVELERRARGDGDRVELEGVVDSVDPGLRTMTLRGVKVSWSTATRFDDIAESNLRVGVRVEVEGRMAADGSTVEALEIERERD